MLRAVVQCLGIGPEANDQGVPLEAGEIFGKSHRATASGDDQSAPGFQPGDGFAFQFAKGVLTGFVENFAHGNAGFGFHQRIGIHKLKPQLARHRAAHGRFPTSHESHEGKVVDGAWVRHRRTVPYWGESKK